MSLNKFPLHSMNFILWVQPLQIWSLSRTHAVFDLGCGSCEWLKAQKVGEFSCYD